MDATTPLTQQEKRDLESGCGRAVTASFPAREHRYLGTKMFFPNVVTSLPTLFSVQFKAKAMTDEVASHIALRIVMGAQKDMKLELTRRGVSFLSYSSSRLLVILEFTCRRIME